MKILLHDLRLCKDKEKTDKKKEAVVIDKLEKVLHLNGLNEEILQLWMSLLSQ